MYSIRKKAAGFVVDQDVRVKNHYLRITSKSGNTFNVWMNGKEVDVFTNFDSIAPGLKIGQWLKDNKEMLCIVKNKGYVTSRKRHVPKM